MLQRVLCALHARSLCVIQARFHVLPSLEAQRLRWIRAQVANLRAKHALGPGTDAQLLDVAERCVSAHAMLQAALQQYGARCTFSTVRTALISTCGPQAS